MPSVPVCVTDAGTTDFSALEFVMNPNDTQRTRDLLREVNGS